MYGSPDPISTDSSPKSSPWRLLIVVPQDELSTGVTSALRLTYRRAARSVHPGVEHRREPAAPLDAALVGLDADDARLRQGQHAGHALEHALVFRADRAVEGDHLFGGHREVVVAPHHEREVTVDVVDRGGEQQQDVLEPGFVMDRAAHRERERESGAHVAVELLGGLTGDRPRTVGI